ncbi:serine acetyltransferase [Paucibacter sp. AS339]|uniref:serine O-acetyltransferase n=1 Tax=Paucibacter hankyongi TaxID=3133434 RepID=UPI0030A7F518
MPIQIYRLARWLFLRGVPLLPQLLKGLNRVLWGVVLPPSADLGRGVLLGYQGLGVVIHKQARIGERVAIGTGVTIGGRSGHAQVPVIEDHVMIGSGAKIMGPVRIGRYASIGANAVVLSDVPDYAVAVGVPARVVRINRPEDIPDYFDF